MSLTPTEAAALEALHYRYLAAYESKDYATSDALRQELYDAGVCNIEMGLWRSVCESKEHLQERMQRRVRAMMDKELRLERQRKAACL